MVLVHASAWLALLPSCLDSSKDIGAWFWLVAGLGWWLVGCGLWLVSNRSGSRLVDGLGSCFFPAGFVAQQLGVKQRFRCLVLVGGWSWLVVNRLWCVVGPPLLLVVAGGWSWLMLPPGRHCCPAVRSQAKILVLGPIGTKEGADGANGGGEAAPAPLAPGRAQMAPTGVGPGW